MPVPNNTTSATATRVVGGAELPAPGVWLVDQAHTSVEFIARHLMLSKVRGRFSEVSGKAVVADDPKASCLEVVIDMASVSTGSSERDDHLRSADFFNVDTHPTAMFQSNAVEWDGGSAAVVRGDLTILGVTRPIALEVEFLGATDDPWGSKRAIFSASTEVDREEWGLSFNVPLESGGVLVGKKIRLEIEAQLILIQ